MPPHSDLYTKLTKTAAESGKSVHTPLGNPEISAATPQTGPKPGPPHALPTSRTSATRPHPPTRPPGPRITYFPGLEPSGPPQIASTPPRQPHTALSARQRLYIDCEMGARAVISVTSPPRHSRAILQAIRPTSCNLAQGGITAASNHSLIRSISAQSHC